MYLLFNISKHKVVRGGKEGEDSSLLGRDLSDRSNASRGGQTTNEKQQFTFTARGGAMQLFLLTAAVPESIEVTKIFMITALVWDTICGK